MEAGYPGAVVQTEGGFDQAGDARRCFRMANVAFHRSQSHGCSGIAIAQHIPQRLGFDRIPQQRPRAMGLNVVHQGRIQMGLGKGSPDHLLLGFSVGGGEAIGAAILIHRTAANHGIDGVAIANGLL